MKLPEMPDQNHRYRRHPYYVPLPPVAIPPTPPSVLAGSPSRGGDVMVYAFDIN